MASLESLPIELDAYADLDAALQSPRWSAERLTVLVALERHDGHWIARLRSRSASASIVAVALDDRAEASNAQHMKGRELLAMAQSTGCDGCLFYATPHEIAATLRALWEVGAP